MFKKKSPQITQILTNKYVFVIIRVICGRKKNLIMFFCYSVFKIKHKKRDTSKSVSPKSWVDDGDRTHDPQDHNLIL